MSTFSVPSSGRHCGARVPFPAPMHGGLRRGIGIALLLAASAAAAQGQSPGDQARQLDEVIVTAPIPKDTGTATKTDTPLIEVPQSISIVTARDIQDRGLHGVEEAVWHTAGTQGGGFGPDTRSDWLLVRGFTPARYLDGLALPEGTWTGATRVEPYGLEQIEVLKGPASVNYGAMPPGGLLNYVSKRPNEDMLNELEVQFGSDSMRQAAFDVGGRLDDEGTLLYRLTGLARNSDTFVDYIHDDRYYFAPALTWRPDEANHLTVLARWQKADTKAGAGFLPPEGTLLPNPNGPISPSLYTGEPNSNDYVKTIASLGYEYRHDFGGDVVFRQSVRLTDAELEPNVVIGTFGLQEDLRTLTRYLFSTQEDERTLGADNNVQWRFGAGGAEHTVLAGLDYRRSRRDYDSGFGFGATGLDAYAPVYGTMPDVRPEFATFTHQEQSQLGLYVQDQIRFDRWLLTVGGRQDWVDTETNGEDQDDSKFSARIGVNYLFDSGFAPYVSYSQSFQATVGSEHPSRGGRAFVPTTGEQVEAGIKYQPESGDALVTLAAYEITQNNVLVVDPDNTLYSIQQGEITSRGLELEGRWNLARNFSLHGAYAYIDAEVTETTDAATLGKQIPLQPRHAASLGGDYTLTEGALAGLGFGLGVRYVGEHYGDSANLWQTASYTLLDAAVHYDFSAWRLQLNVQNLTDKEYLSTCDSAFWCYYGYPRSVTATARFLW